MVELKIYKCDRCNEKFELEVGSEPEGISINQFSEVREYQWCSNCMAALNRFIANVKEFDKLAEEMWAKEFPE